MDTKYNLLLTILEYSNPDIKIGDTLLVGRFKNKKAIVKGFSTDKNLSLIHI